MAEKNDNHRLSQVFLAARRDPSRANAGEEDAHQASALDRQLGSIVKEAKTAWPEISLDLGVYVRHLARYVNDSEPSEEGLRALRNADLYLSCACLEGEVEALRCLEKICLREVQKALGWHDSKGGLGDDVLQLLLQRLLVGEPNSNPKLALYRGRSSLYRWIHVVTRRLVSNLRRSKGVREFPIDDFVLASLIAPSNPELAVIKQRYLKEFKTAFFEALGILSARDRNVLRNHFIDRMSIDEIGKLYRVSRATAARWLQQIRTRLRDETEQRLSDRLQISTDDFQSIVRLIMTQFDAVGLQRFFRDSAEG